MKDGAGGLADCGRLGYQEFHEGLPVLVELPLQHLVADTETVWRREQHYYASKNISNCTRSIFFFFVSEVLNLAVYYCSVELVRVLFWSNRGGSIFAEYRVESPRRTPLSLSDKATGRFSSDEEAACTLNKPREYLRIWPTSY